MTKFQNYGTPGHRSVNTTADVTLLFAETPVYGARVQSPAITAPVPINSLIKANGTLAESGETAVGVTTVEITQAMITAAGDDDINTVYATSGNFVYEALNLDDSLTTLTLARATVASLENILINSHRYAAV